MLLTVELMITKKQKEKRNITTLMKIEIDEIIKNLYHDSMQYYNPHSEYGVGYADGILDVCSKLGIQCRKIDEGVLEFD